MRHLDLFSGIGGFALAATWAFPELKIVSFCEIDKFCQKVLNKNFPGVPIHDDVKTLDASKWREQIDLLTGGFPCQPFSCAGKRRAQADDRYLWPKMFRVISECLPRWIVGENVANIVKLGLDTVLSDLEGIGYAVQPFIIPALAVGAPHIRERVWIVANGNDKRQLQPKGSEQNKRRRIGYENKSAASDTDSQHIEEFERRNKLGHAREAFGRCFYEPNWTEDWPSVATRLCRMDDGVPRKLDRVRAISAESASKTKKVAGREHRIKALGNAIVPQVAFEIFKAIKEVDLTA